MVGGHRGGVHTWEALTVGSACLPCIKVRNVPDRSRRHQKRPRTIKISWNCHPNVMQWRGDWPHSYGQLRALYRPRRAPPYDVGVLAHLVPPELRCLCLIDAAADSAHGKAPAHSG